MNTGTSKKAKSKNDREVILTGKPCLDSLSQNERKLFLSTLLEIMIEMREEKDRRTNKRDK